MFHLPYITYIYIYMYYGFGPIVFYLQAVDISMSKNMTTALAAGQKTWRVPKSWETPRDHQKFITVPWFIGNLKLFSK